MTLNQSMKRNHYIFLTIICIFFIIFIQNFYGTSYTPKNTGLDLKIPTENILENINIKLFSLLFILYLYFFFSGIIHLIIFIIKKIIKKPETKFLKTIKSFPLSEEKSSKIIFLISFLLLISYFLQISISLILWKQMSAAFLLFINLLLQIGTILIIFIFLGYKYFNFYFDRKQLSFLIKIYCIIIPLIVLSAWISHLIAIKFRLDMYTSPIIKLFSILPNKFYIFMLIIQIVIIGPIAEELFFRGFIYKLFRTKYNFLISAGFISAFFALIHKIPQNIIPLFIISMALCYIYEKTENILYSIIFHSFHNFLSLMFFFAIKNNF